MSALAATLEAYFADRLIGQRHASPHTVAAYRVLRTWLSEVSTRGWQVMCRQGWSWQ
jgi:hypothetical protein